MAARNPAGHTLISKPLGIRNLAGLGRVAPFVLSIASSFNNPLRPRGVPKQMIRLFRKKGGFTLIELMIVVAIIGILAAIAIPNFIRFQAKSKQSEAKTNLKALYTSQKAYFGEKDKYITNYKTLGFQPEAGNRYSYGLAASCKQAQDLASRTYTTGCIGQDAVRFPTVPPTSNDPVATVGITGACPSCDFNASAVGNVDNDDNADTWAITSSATSVTLAGTCGIDGTTTSGGEPTNSYNDVSCP